MMTYLKLFFVSNLYVCSWHSAGTYDVKTKTGGPYGSIRNEQELNHAANMGLKIAVDLCGRLSSSCLGTSIPLSLSLTLLTSNCFFGFL